MKKFNEFLTGNYWLYILELGGTGIVKAKNEDEAYQKVYDAYSKHNGKDGFTESIYVEKLECQKPFDDAKDVMEICCGCY